MGAGWRDTSIEVVFRDGVRALVPRLSRPVARGLFRQLEASPPGVYGAPLVKGEGLSRDQWRAISRLFSGLRISDAVLIESPGREIDFGVRRDVAYSHLLKLAPGETEHDLLRRYRKGHRSAVGSARRHGLVVELVSREEDFKAYHEMYLKTVARWERNPYLVYPLAMFNVLGELARETDGVRLWLVRHGGTLLAGALSLQQGQHAAYWHGASTEEGRERNAGQLAVHAAILDAAGQGVEFFDFMPSAGLEGVQRFKSGFGAEEFPFGIHRFPRSRAYSLLRRLLGRKGGKAG